MSRQYATAAATADIRPNHRAAAKDAYEDVAVLTLDDNGLILDCSSAAETLFKYGRREMIWRHVSMMLPQLATVDLMPNGVPNPVLRFLCHIGHLFRAVARDGESYPCELFLTSLLNEGRSGLLLIVRPTISVSEQDAYGSQATPRRHHQAATHG